ncbi:hypothetical protein [Nostoc sp. MG11]|nr:hypothetical protein [Nostoc sp. MG11]
MAVSLFSDRLKLKILKSIGLLKYALKLTYYRQSTEISNISLESYSMHL